MARLKLTLVALCIALTFSALATNTALAEWYVAGAKLAAGSKVALASTASANTATIISIPTLGFTVTCTSKGIQAKQAEILGPNIIKTQGLLFEGCEGSIHTCPTEPTVATQPLTGLVTRSLKSEDRVTFSPQTKGVFLGIRFKEATGCLLEGTTWPISGEVTFGAPPSILEERQAQAIEYLGTTENNSLEGSSLEVAHDKVYLTGGNILLALASRSKWSFH